MQTRKGNNLQPLVLPGSGFVPVCPHFLCSPTSQHLSLSHRYKPPHPPPCLQPGQQQRVLHLPGKGFFPRTLGKTCSSHVATWPGWLDKQDKTHPPSPKPGTWVEVGVTPVEAGDIKPCLSLPSLCPQGVGPFGNISPKAAPLFPKVLLRLFQKNTARAQENVSSSLFLSPFAELVHQVLDVPCPTRALQDPAVG